MGQVERYPNGTFCSVDLGTTDAPGAKAFYGGLFGWEFDDLPTGRRAPNSTCRLDGLAVAGLHDRAETPGWGSSISVDDVGRAAGRARELGAEVLVEPFDTPGGGRVATVRDPAGATVSLSQPGERFGAQLVNQDSTWTWNELVSNDLAAGARSWAAGAAAARWTSRSGGSPSWPTRRGRCSPPPPCPAVPSGASAGPSGGRPPRPAGARARRPGSG